MCRAASSCSVVQRRAVNQNAGSPSIRRPVPSGTVSRAQRTSARAPFSCGRTYGVCSASTDSDQRPEPGGGPGVRVRLAGAAAEPLARAQRCRTPEPYAEPGQRHRPVALAG